jgi:hypothetical protein
MASGGPGGVSEADRRDEDRFLRDLRLAIE